MANKALIKTSLLLQKEIRIFIKINKRLSSIHFTTSAELFQVRRSITFNIMKKLSLLVLSSMLFSIMLIAQHEEPSKDKKLYDPSADAKADLAQVIKKAAKEHKHVLLQIGGNWCSWCIAFDKKVKSKDALLSEMNKNFVVYHLNFSKENKNEKILADLGYPQRFGFPVFVILDGKGNRLHTQNSAYLEEGDGHSFKKVLEFFEHWSPKALDSTQYEGK